MKPLVAAIGAGTVTMVAMGGATMLVSSLALGVAKNVSKQRQRKLAIQCRVCQGNCYVPCDVCLGRGIIRTRRPRSMKQILLEAKGGKSSNGISATENEAVMCTCPACGTTLQQRCLNCLGEGSVFIPN